MFNTYDLDEFLNFLKTVVEAKERYSEFHFDSGKDWNYVNSFTSQALFDSTNNNASDNNRKRFLFCKLKGAHSSLR